MQSDELPRIEDACEGLAVHDQTLATPVVRLFDVSSERLNALYGECDQEQTSLHSAQGIMALSLRSDVAGCVWMMIASFLWMRVH